ncbi:hypothetical protein D9758_012470 [Tetrapyrgos nigripes]|uniref:Uncharacterized protein n=1 Tax=Tetrapyrgos nigripes TaxID=182062 RepID=A0A8H5CYL7_9AGAR|nr:hypothetical protein D9758_012470 [Tetrapyrgos nigripes]
MPWGTNPYIPLHGLALPTLLTNLPGTHWAQTSMLFLFIILLITFIVITALLFILLACAVFSFKWNVAHGRWQIRMHSASMHSSRSRSRNNQPSRSRSSEKKNYEERRKDRNLVHKNKEELLRLRKLVQAQTERLDSLVMEAHRQMEEIRQELRNCQTKPTGTR